MVDRPFASPGDFVAIRLLPGCDDASEGLGADGGNYVVSVVFTPPSGLRSLVVLATDCGALLPELERCAPALARPPLCVAAEDGLGIPGLQLAERDGARTLRFRFPDTDTMLDAAEDDRTLAGPVALAVIRSGSPLPCDLGAQRCAATSGLVACIDQLFEPDGTCGTRAHSVFPHFTALPPPNDFQALCVDRAPPCAGRAEELRFTADAEGNLLIPMDWRGVLPLLQPLGAVTQRTFAIPRLLRGVIAPAALVTGPVQTLPIPGSEFVRAYSSEGGLLPPVFEPQVDPSQPEQAILFGSADAPVSVLRVARRSPSFAQCDGGSRAGQPCTSDGQCPQAHCAAATCTGGARGGQTCAGDDECPDAECGPALFELRHRFASGIGPIILPRFGAGLCQARGLPCVTDSDCAADRCVGYRLEAKDPVPLDGLIESPRVLVTVVPEAIAGRDLNGDGDRFDDVLLLADRYTGTQRLIGEGGAAGVAATRLRQPPFSYAAVAVEEQITAFLEAEPHQGYTDANGDGDHFDTILRVYSGDGTSVRDLTGGLNLAIDAAPAVNGQSLVVSDGLVFFRIAEAANVRRRLVRASVTSEGEPANARSRRPVLSRNGRHVAFESVATNLLPFGAASPLGRNAYVHDLSSGRTVAVQVSSEIVPDVLATRQPSLSGDGRYVAVSVPDVAGVRQVFRVDRDADGNGIFDEAGGVAVRLVSVTSSGTLGERDSLVPSLSSNGRFVGFVSASTTLIGGDPRYPTKRVLLFDAASAAAHFDFTPVHGGGVATQPPTVSDDGAVVVFASVDRDALPGGDQNEYCQIIGSPSTSCADVFVTDRARGITELISRSSFGEQGNNQSLSAAMSADGRRVAFVSAATNLVPGDTNGVVDVFLRDRISRSTTRVSVSSDGAQADSSSFDRAISISADGRYIAFSSRASNLAPGDSNAVCDDGLGGAARSNCTDVFVHDSLTGFTERVSVAPDGTQGNERSGSPSISADGHTVAFESEATSLVAKANESACDPQAADFEDRCQDILVAAPDETDLTYDLTADGDLDDTVLAVLDARSDEPAVRLLGASGDAAVAGGRAAFLVPERTPCAASGTDLNGDGDANDLVVHLFGGRAADFTVENLGRAAAAVALSDSWIAALIDEAAQGEGDLNGDGDAADLVVAVRPLAGGEWVNGGQAADSVQIAGAMVAFLTPESDQDADLNDDGDRADRVIQVYDADAAQLFAIGMAAEEFVVSDRILAFRTSEAAHGNQVLNDDGDTLDSVLQVCDLPARRCFNTGQTAVPCRLEACDPRWPYRLAGSVVKFLVLEADQNADLNDDGDRRDVILQTFNVALAAAEQRHDQGTGGAGAAGIARYSWTRSAQLGVQSGVLTSVGAVTAGICSNSGAACIARTDCGTGTCYLPPGGCLVNLGSSCDPALSNQPCGGGEFCAAAGGRWFCHQRMGDCVTDADCTPPAQCRDENRAADRLFNPFLSADDGSVAFVGAGRCTEDLGVACGPDGRCSAGGFCAPKSGGSASCQHDHGSCRRDADCPQGVRCQAEPIVAAARDTDDDGIADPFDNCAAVRNADQLDVDRDGIGDACAAAAQFTPTGPPNTPTGGFQGTPSNGGCQLDPVNGASPQAALVLLGAVLLLWLSTRGAAQRSRWVVRRANLPSSRDVLWAGLLAICLIGKPATALPLPTCPGDCDGSGAVTVEEIITLIEAVLEGSASACAAGDLDSNAVISVDEALAAVDVALQGCPPSTEALGAVALSVSRAVADASSLPLLLVAAIGALGVSGDCRLGGAYFNSCDEISGELIRIPVSVQQCVEPTLEGPIRFDGGLLFTGIGLCPDILLPGSTTVRTDVTATRETVDGEPLLTTHMELTVIPESFGFAGGRQGCRVRGTRALLDGPIHYTLSDGFTVTLDFRRAGAAFEFQEFAVAPLCDIARLTLRLTGAATVEDVDGDSVHRTDVDFDGLMITLRRTQNLIDIAGALALPSLGTTVELTSLEPLVLPIGAACFTAGVLHAATPSTQALLRFSESGVQIDADLDGIPDVVLPSCRDLGPLHRGLG